MQLTPDILLALGFVRLPGKLDRYAYRGINGILESNGLFFFDDFGLCITRLSDLEFMLMLIDHQDQASLPVLPSSDN